MILETVPLISLKSGKLKFKLNKSKQTKKAGQNVQGEDEYIPSVGSSSTFSDLSQSDADVGFTAAQKSSKEEKDASNEIYPSLAGNLDLSLSLDGTDSATNTMEAISPAPSTKSNAFETPGTASSQSQSARIGAGGAPEAIKRIFEAEFLKLDQKEQDCELIHEENTSHIYFKIPDMKTSKLLGRHVYCILQCADISAGDLKVTTRFGSWDSMVARVLIECDGPMFLWKQRFDPQGNKLVDPQNVLYDYQILKSCMVKGSFSVEYISKVCKMMHLVKVAKTREIMNVKKLQKDGMISNKTKLPSKIREGLPEWVNYIPYRWYSAKMRRVIEYALVIYTIVSLLWAVWQLYRHVDFIRSYLRPIVLLIEHYLSIFKSWFQWMDDLFTMLSHYWWHYFKPILMLLGAALSPLFQIFRPLKGIINLIPHLFDPFVQFFNMIYLFIKPIAIPFKALYGFASQYFVTIVTSVYTELVRNPTVANIIRRGSEFYVVQLLHEALHGHLDPLKAQVVVIRDLIFKSSRKIYYGVRFILNKTYFMIIFLRRERQYSSEGLSMDQNMQEDVKPKQD